MVNCILFLKMALMYFVVEMMKVKVSILVLVDQVGFVSLTGLTWTQETSFKENHIHNLVYLRFLLVTIKTTVL